MKRGPARRALCPVCGREQAVTRAGRIWAHDHPRLTLCAGTGRVAAEIRRLSEVTPDDPAR